jgi:hypothetical protein
MFLGEAAAASDANGQASFALTVDGSGLAAIPASFTATATSSNGATSEFSQPVALSPPMFPPERIVCLTEETVETLYLPGDA